MGVVPKLGNGFRGRPSISVFEFEGCSVGTRRPRRRFTLNGTGFVPVPAFIPKAGGRDR
jgi:hypothetical protein